MSFDNSICRCQTKPCAPAYLLGCKKRLKDALGGFFIYQKQNCYSGGKVDYKVTNKPDHGKVTIRYERHQLGKSAGKCEGRPAGAMVVRYTPDRGFRGKDKIVVSFYFDKFAGGGAPRSRTVTYTVTVK